MKEDHHITRFLPLKTRLVLREGDEVGQIDPDIAPPQKIRTVEHKAWQANSVPIPKGLEFVAVELLKKRLARGVVEESHGPYRNPWFLVRKKDGNYRLINSAT